HGLAPAIDLLVSDWGLLSNFSRISLEHKRSGLVDRQTSHAGKTKTDLSGILIRRNDEIVFQLPLFSVIDQVYARINFAKFNSGVSWDLAGPVGAIASVEVVDLPTHFILAGNFRISISADHLHAHNGRLLVLFLAKA